MYKKFFGLAEAPFNITPDSRFLFLSQRHREALSALLYGIKERKGFILLTGEIGAGKTTLCRALVNELGAESINVALILNPGLSELELLKTINDELQIPSFYDTKKGLVDALNQYLITESQRGNNTVLIIDEAQNLSPILLEQIRMLSNLETENDKLIQIVLMGQPELNDTLNLSQLEQLNQRIVVRFHITPLTETEMLAYIKHRLFVARAKIDIEFTDAAIRLAYGATRGIPRKINVLCDRALLACYAAGSYTVDDKIMQKAISEIAGNEPAGSAKTRRRQGPGAHLRALLTRKLAIAFGAVVIAFVLISISVAIGLRLANVNFAEHPSPRPAALAEGETPEPRSQKGYLSRDFKPRKRDTQEDAPGTTVTKAAPTPTPDFEKLRRTNPNWKYEPNVPLVRVNNPKSVKRAAQLSILKMWGIAVDLGEMAKLSEDLVTRGELKSETVRIREVPIPGDYYEAVRFNMPLIVRIKDPSSNRSEYVVLLKAEGEAVTTGDPVWGVKIYQTKEFIKHWAGASTIVADISNLGAIQKGEKSERVKALQLLLKSDSYLEEVNGTFDTKTAEAIQKLQRYYNLTETGKLDDLTLMILNSRMMRNGPHLNAAGLTG
jgi:type II secretory pathway predicted ATPase ExeA